MNPTRSASLFAGRRRRPRLEYRFRGRLALALKPLVQIYDALGYLLWNRNKEFADISRIRSIAIVQPSGLGDVLLTLPLLHYLQQRRGLKVTLVVPRAAATWLAHARWLDRVVGLDIPFLVPRDKRPDYAEAIAALQALDADIIYEVRGDLRLCAMLYRSGFAVGGFGCGGGGFMLDRVLDFKSSFHAMDMYNAILRDLNISDDPLVDWSPDLMPVASSAVALPPDFVAIHVGTGWQSKQWPLKNFITLVEWLAKSRPVVILGGPRDLDAAHHEALARVSNCTNLVGQLDFAESLGVVSRAGIFVGQDTGTTHGAALLGKPVVALYSGIDDYRFLPPQLYPGQVLVIQNRPPCSGPNGCARRICEDNICMTDISVSQVMRAVEEQSARPPHTGAWQPGIAPGRPWKAPR